MSIRLIVFSVATVLLCFGTWILRPISVNANLQYARLCLGSFGVTLQSEFVSSAINYYWAQSEFTGNPEITEMRSGEWRSTNPNVSNTWGGTWVRLSGGLRVHVSLFPGYHGTMTANIRDENQVFAVVLNRCAEDTGYGG